MILALKSVGIGIRNTILTEKLSNFAESNQ